MWKIRTNLIIILLLLLLTIPSAYASTWKMIRPSEDVRINDRVDSSFSDGVASVGVAAALDHYLEGTSTWGGDAMLFNVTATANSRRGIAYNYDTVPYEWLVPSPAHTLPFQGYTDDVGCWINIARDCPNIGVLRFYGGPLSFEYETVWVCSNGFISFDSSNSTSPTPTVLPDPAEPNALIAALWTDLEFDDQSSITYGEAYQGGTKCFVVSWNNMIHKVTREPQTFQIQIEAPGYREYCRQSNIWISYKSVGSIPPPYAGLGIEDQEGLKGWGYLDFSSPVSNYRIMCWQDCHSAFVKSVCIELEEDDDFAMIDILEDPDVTGPRGYHMQMGMEPPSPDPNSQFAWALSGPAVLLMKIGGFAFAPLGPIAGVVGGVITTINLAGALAYWMETPLAPPEIKDWEELPQGAFINASALKVFPLPPEFYVVDALLGIKGAWVFNDTDGNLDHSLKVTAKIDYIEYDIVSGEKAEKTISTSVDLTVMRRRPWDMNNDKLVDIIDIVLVAVAFGSEPGDENWNSLADIAEQWELVDIVDIVLVAIHYGDDYHEGGLGPPSGSHMTGPLMGGTTAVSIQPDTIIVYKDEMFSVNVTITDIASLYGWEFKLYWNRTILNCTDAETHAPSIWSGDTFEAGSGFQNNFSMTQGRYSKALSALYPAPSFNGSMTIATLTFKAIATGTTILDLQDTKLVDSKADTITLATEDGSVTVLHGRYMRGDTHTVNNLTAYVLNATKSDIPQNRSRSDSLTYVWGSGFIGATDAYYGIRVWVRHANGTEIELTSGTPIAQVSRNQNGEGIQTATWNYPETSLSSADALVVRVYIGFYIVPGGYVEWPSECSAEFITEQLEAEQLVGSTLTIYYYTKCQFIYTGPGLKWEVHGYFYWGTNTYNSRIENIQYT